MVMPGGGEAHPASGAATILAMPSVVEYQSWGGEGGGRGGPGA